MNDLNGGDKVLLSGANVADRGKVWTVYWTAGSHVMLRDDDGQTIVANRWSLARYRNGLRAVKP